MKKLMSVAMVLLVLSGCASVPMASVEADAEAKEFKTPPEGKSGLYVFRDGFMGQALKKTITVDGEFLGETAPDVYFYKVLDAGEHTVSTESEFSPNDLIINTESQKNYFLENYMKPGLFVGGANLKQVSEEEGMKRVSKLQLAQ